MDGGIYSAQKDVAVLMQLLDDVINGRKPCREMDIDQAFGELDVGRRRNLRPDDPETC